jgi:plasmid replication initiation protein
MDKSLIKRGIIDNSQLVYKRNELAEQSYKLTVREQKLLILLASNIKRNEKHFNIVQFKTSDIATFLKIKKQSAYNDIKKLTYSLLKKGFRKIGLDKNELQINWLASAEYKEIKGESIVELEFSEKLKEFYLELQTKYFKYHIEGIIQFKSFYSIRIYEIIKANKYKNKVYFTIAYLKKCFDIENDPAYQKYNNFKRRVILTAYDEINASKKTDIKFEFDEVKEKRRVVGIVFLIDNKNNNGSNEQTKKKLEIKAKISPDEKVFIESVLLFQINEETACKAIKEHGLQGAAEIRDYVLKRAQKDENMDIGAYMAKGFVKGFGKKTPQERKQKEAETTKTKNKNRKTELENLSDDFKKAVKVQRREQANQEFENLSDIEKKKLKIQFGQLAEQGKYSDYVKKNYKIKGLEGSGVRTQFNFFVAEKLLSPKKDDLREYSKSKGYDYDRLQAELNELQKK